MKEKTRLKLTALIDKPSRCFGTAYAHVRLYPRVEAFDAATRKWVWYSSNETHDGIYHRDLMISCQIDDSHTDDRASYAWQVEYHRPSSVDLRMAQAMAKTLDKIYKRLEKLREEFGWPATYGGYVARVANALRAEAIIFPHEEKLPDTDIERLPGEAAAYIDRDVLDLANQCREIAGKEKLVA